MPVREDGSISGCEVSFAEKDRDEELLLEEEEEDCDDGEEYCCLERGTFVGGRFNIIIGC